MKLMYISSAGIGLSVGTMWPDPWIFEMRENIYQIWRADITRIVHKKCHDICQQGRLLWHSFNSSRGFSLVTPRFYSCHGCAHLFLLVIGSFHFLRCFFLWLALYTLSYVSLLLIDLLLLVRRVSALIDSLHFVRCNSSHDWLFIPCQMCLLSWLALYTLSNLFILVADSLCLVRCVSSHDLLLTPCHMCLFSWLTLYALSDVFHLMIDSLYCVRCASSHDWLITPCQMCFFSWFTPCQIAAEMLSIASCQLFQLLPQI